MLFTTTLITGCGDLLTNGNSSSGVNSTETNITMSLYADLISIGGYYYDISEVSIAGTFNNWAAGTAGYFMEAKSNGNSKYFSTSVSLPFGTNVYKYCARVSGSTNWIWLTDMRQSSNIIIPRPTGFQTDGYGGFNALLILNKYKASSSANSGFSSKGSSSSVVPTITSNGPGSFNDPAGDILLQNPANWLIPTEQQKTNLSDITNITITEDAGYLKFKVYLKDLTNVWPSRAIYQGFDHVLICIYLQSPTGLHNKYLFGVVGSTGYGPVNFGVNAYIWQGWDYALCAEGFNTILMDSDVFGTTNSVKAQGYNAGGNVYSTSDLSLKFVEMNVKKSLVDYTSKTGWKFIVMIQDWVDGGWGTLWRLGSSLGNIRRITSPAGDWGFGGNSTGILARDILWNAENPTAQITELINIRSNYWIGF